MSRKTIQITVILALIFTLVIIFVFTSIYNKPHVNVQETAPNLSITSHSLLNDFILDETQANAKYLEKIVQVNGPVSEINLDKEGNRIIALSSNDVNEIGSVTCYLDTEESKTITPLKKGEFITIKGICTGYLMDVVLIKCVIIN